MVSEEFIKQETPNFHINTKPRKILEDHEMEKIKHFLKDESGASAVEYGLLVALIAVVIITAVQLIGTNLSSKFNTVATTVGT